MTELALPLARKAGEHLKARGMPNGRLEAELLLASVLGLRRLDLYLQHDRPVEAGELAAFRAKVRRRLRGEPIQYITGEAAFRTLVLNVDRRVLIPRPETEVLVGEVLAWSGGRTDVAALDVGTGSGAIALSLAVEGGFASVVATDASAEALALACENAVRVGASRVDFRGGSTLEPVRPGEQFDIVVSNPPYVAEHERATLPAEVRDHEPAAALFADRNGLGVILDLVEGAPAVLRPGGLLALEIGADQVAAVRNALDATRRYGEVRTVRDLCGVERVVLAETNH